jgi:Cu/Ag efflux protein CusF
MGRYELVSIIDLLARLRKTPKGGLVVLATHRGNGRFARTHVSCRRVHIARGQSRNSLKELNSRWDKQALTENRAGPERSLRSFREPIRLWSLGLPGSSISENSMRLAKIILTSAMVIGIGMPAAMAQQTIEGMITKINRLNGTIAIQQTQSGTVGASAAAAAEEFKVQDGSLLEAVHAGDQVTYSVAESGGVKTITKLQKQKP